MSNDDRSRRVWRLLERGWTTARALRDTIEQVRGKVDEARVRLSDEVVSRIAGQPVRTQPDPARGTESDPTPDAPPVDADRPPESLGSDERQTLVEAADAVSDADVREEALRSVPAAPPRAPDMPPEVPPTGPAFPAGALPPVPRPITAPPAAPAPDFPPAPESRVSWADAVDAPLPAPMDGPPSAQVVPGTPPTDPDALVEGEIVALARDAEWLFVYWDLDAERVATAQRLRGDRQFLLRVVQPAGTGLVHQSSAAVPSGRRYVRVPFADASYRAELWARSGAEEVLVARSLPASTPPALPRPVGTAAMMSSRTHQSVLSAHDDLTQTPRLSAAEVDGAQAVAFNAIAAAHPEWTEASAGGPAGAAPEGPAASYEVMTTVDATGSELRLTVRAAGAAPTPGAPVVGFAGAELPRVSGAHLGGSEDRLGPGGSEDRLGGGSESRLGAPEDDK